MTNPIFFKIPQAAPFKMVDEVLEYQPDFVRCTFVPAADHIMVHGGKFTPEGIVEFIAQSAAAYAGVYDPEDKDFVPKIGFIAAVKSFFCHTLPDAGTRLVAELQFKQEILQFQVWNALVKKDEEIIAGCEIRIFEIP